MNNDFNDIFDKEQLKQNPFKVPAGYFDSLNTRIMENVARQASARRAKSQPRQRMSACMCSVGLQHVLVCS